MKHIKFSSGSLGENFILETILKKSFGNINVKKLLEYEDPLGVVELRNKIIDLHSKGLDKDNIIITTSAQQALVVIVNYLSKSNATFFVQEPAYFGIFRLIKDRVATFENVSDLSRGGKIKKRDVVYLTSNYHNPTGNSLNNEEKINIIKFAKELDLKIVEDNPCDFLYYNQNRLSNLFELNLGRVFYVGGFSKILAPGLRIGYIISDSQNIRAIKSYKIDQDIFTSTLSQQVCINALNNSEYLNDLRLFFKSKRDLTLKLLDKYFGYTDKVSWNNPEGGIFILMNISKEISVSDIILLAKEKYNLCLEDDKYMYLNRINRNSIRINFVQNSDETLEEGIDRLHCMFKEIGHG